MLVVSRPSPLVALAAAALLSSACQQELVGDCAKQAGGCPDDEQEELDPPRLYVDPPFGVGFECVTIGCAEERTFRVENRGDGRVAVSLVRLSTSTSGDITIALADVQGLAPPAFPSEDDLIELRRGEAFDVVVRYQPSDALPDEGTLWIDWYDGALAFEDAAPERVEMPITTRVLGDPSATLVTSTLNFGYVPAGEELVLPIKVTNTAEGTAVLALSPPVFDVESDPQFALAFGVDEPVLVNPGETAEIAVAFTPSETDWYQGVVYLPTNDGAHPQLAVSLLGTAIQAPFFSVVQPSDWVLEHGDLRVGESNTRQVRIRNLGGQPLSVTAQLPVGADVGFATMIPLGQPLPTVAPLGEISFDVSATPTAGGDLWGEMRFTTNDPTLPADWIDLHVYGVAPEGYVDPAELHFGDLAQSWTSEAQTISISNAGTGDLTISGVSFELGSSPQVKFADLPTLPVKLRAGDEPLRISVFVQATVVGVANAVVLVETDGVVTQTLRVPVFANVVTCEQACPVANGVPTCNAGFCEIGSCLPQHYDSDQQYGTGCECGEDTVGAATRDISSFCSSDGNVGPLADECGSGTRDWVYRNGTLHTESDEDNYFFHADDGGSITCDTFGDSFKARVQLVSPPPGVELCVRATGGGGACGGENQRTCGLTSWDTDSGWGSDGDVDVTVWVRRTPGAPPMCGAYQVRFCANDDNC